MTLERIIRQRKGKAGSNGAWRVQPSSDAHPLTPLTYELWHYGTLMLRWYEGGGTVEVLYMSTGYGSVSDQNGMNTAFKVLSIPLYYTRKGGADIIDIPTKKG